MPGPSAVKGRPAGLAPGSPGGRLRRRLLRHLTEGRLMLASGIVMMAFLASHLLNHALGLISVAAMEAGRVPFVAFWRLLPVEIVLLLALLVHLVVALRQLWRRRHLKLPPTDLLQLVLGFAIPFMLIGHVLGTGGVHRLLGVEDSYLFELVFLWPGNAGWQTALTLTAWLHGCIGIWRRARLQRPSASLTAWMLVLAVLLPILSLLGFTEGGREVARLKLAQPEVIEQAAREQRWPTPDERRDLVLEPALVVRNGFYLVTLAVLLAASARYVILRRRRGVRITYEDGTEIRGSPGATLLEMSRGAGIPHAAVCGGRGRCSTCRVRVQKGQGRLPPPGTVEQRVLQRIGADADVRLACQVRPRHGLRITRLITPAASTAQVMQAMHPHFGQERELVAMFVDIRGFTRLTEAKLPFDTVFLLNRYFAAMGGAIEHAGGHLDKFVGDGIVAFFGAEATPAESARQALRACREMARRLARLNEELAQDLAVGDPEGGGLRIGIGLHAGPAIVGEMGFGRARSLTAIGDTMNVASRLEALNKEFGTQLAAGMEVFRRAGVDLGQQPREVDLRGRTGKIDVLVFTDARELPDLSPTGVPTRGWRSLLAAGGEPKDLERQRS